MNLSGDELMVLQSSEGLTKSLLGVMCVVGECVESTKGRKGSVALTGLSWQSSSYLGLSPAPLVSAKSGTTRHGGILLRFHGGRRSMKSKWCQMASKCPYRCRWVLVLPVKGVHPTLGRKHFLGRNNPVTFPPASSSKKQAAKRDPMI